MKKIAQFIILALVLVIGLIGCDRGNKTNKLPNLFGQSLEEIQESLTNVNATINYINYYSPTQEVGQFIKYGDDLKFGDTYEAGQKIDVYIADVEIRLPDLAGLNLEQMTSELGKLGVPEAKLTYLPQEGTDAVNKVYRGFLRYSSFAVGEFVNIDENRLAIIYDSRVYAPDLTGSIRYEIEKALADAKTVTFTYIVDNTKEMDTFKEYKNVESGSLIPYDTPIEVVLYDNDDINKADNIVNPNQIFISKYIDVNQEEHGIEIYNPGTEAVELSDYYIAILEDGATQPTRRIDLEGTLEGKNTYVVLSTAAKGELKAKANLQSPDMKFDGNDVVQLRQTKNNTYIDTIYEIGNINILFDDEIYVRRESVTTSTRDFQLLEWAGFIPEYIDPIGTHPFTISTTPEFKLISDKTFQEYGMTKVEYKGAADGDTVYFKSLDPRDTASYDGTSRIRFLMVDTPETKKPGQPGQPYAQVAYAFTRNIMENATEIYIQSSPGDGLKENYGRHLGLIWANMGTKENPDWKLLNYELLKNGLGIAAGAKTDKYKLQPIFGNRYLYQWVQEGVNYAKEHKLGIYSGVHKD